MVDRRSLLKAGLAGVAGTALLGNASAQTDWQRLVIRNVGRQWQIVRVEIDGRARLGPESSRDEDFVQNRGSEAVISAFLDPGAIDDFRIDGEITNVEWTGTEPRLTLDGRRLDLDDYTDGDDDDDDDDDDDWSRVQFIATDDDLNAVLRVSGTIRGRGDDEIRVLLDEDEVRTLYYTGNIRELRTANGEIDVNISQVRP